MSKISLASRISAVEAAAQGKQATMTRGQRELHETHLAAAVKTLRWVAEHEETIRGNAMNRQAWRMIEAQS